MWYLVGENDKRVIYIAGQNSEVTIGRNADSQSHCFTIPDDPSISRKHAILSKSNNGLFLQDLGSRYGTFLNNSNENIETQTMVKLNDGDIVKFGKMSSVFTVHYRSLVTCTSTLKGENLNNLRECISQISGVLKNEWDENCMFLTMPAITLTMKVVLALVQGAHIVTVDFWSKCLVAVNNQTELPDPSNFTPQVIESTLNKESVSFLPNNERRLLFTGKKVVFFSKRQFEMYKIVLTKASATPLLLSEAKMTKSALCDNNVIVIQYNINAASQESQAQRNLIQDIVNYLKSKGKRLITDVEIGLAILYCSTEKYCNPDFYFPSEMIKQTDHNIKPSNVLAQESQEPNHIGVETKRENVVINESLSSTVNNANNENLNSSKRKVCDDDDMEEHFNKKLATTSAGASSSVFKRKVNEDDDIDTNPFKKVATGSEADDSQDSFNFINKSSTNNVVDQEKAAKKLNLAKPQKRKLDSDDNEDGLFQFVQNKSKLPCNKSNIFEMAKGIANIKTEISSESTPDKDKSIMSNDIDLSSLRGAKLEELMKNNEKLMTTENAETISVKKELEDKMNGLNLGTTIVTVKKELIVKREPKFVENQSDTIKNFKKFKKVWPLKMQISIISKSDSTDNHLSTNNFLEDNTNRSLDIQTEQ